MTVPTHVMLGMIVGKVTGNYTVGITSSVFVDLDHLQSYFTHGALFNPKKLWATVTATTDPYGDQRGIFHNVIVFAVVSILSSIFFYKIGIIIAIGWLGHLCLDALNTSGFWPLYPNKSIHLHGPINYASFREFLFFCFLAMLYVVL